MNNTFKILLSVIGIINALPLVGAVMNFWNWTDISYFYLIECVLFGLVTIFINAKALLVMCFLLVLSGAVYKMSGSSTEGDWKVPLVFWTLYSICWLSYVEIGKTRFWLKARRLSPLRQFMIYFLYMFFSLIVCFSITATMFNGWQLASAMPSDVYLTLVMVAIGLPTVAIGIMRMVNIIGANHFFHFITGTYYRPLERERIVMFLDMVGSTAMAEKLAPKDGMRLIAQFIFDASAIIRIHGGDILNYTGDGLVVTWPIKQSERVLSAITALNNNMKENQLDYKREFNYIPEYRVGVHAGNVVISQIGEEKLFLGLYGDTVNTAARIEQMNKTLDTKILLSKEAIAHMSVKASERLKNLGEHGLRGRKEKITLYTLNAQERIKLS